jgi:hypothetical protein
MTQEDVYEITTSHLGQTMSLFLWIGSGRIRAERFCGYGHINSTSFEH